jgi:hypothetical protein
MERLLPNCDVCRRDKLDPISTNPSTDNPIPTRLPQITERVEPALRKARNERAECTFDISFTDKELRVGSEASPTRVNFLNDKELPNIVVSSTDNDAPMQYRVPSTSETTLPNRIKFRRETVDPIVV